MKLSLLFILVTLSVVLLSCSSPNRPAANKYTIDFHPDSSEHTQADSLGAIIKTIDFRQKATGEDLKTFKEGEMHWIDLDSIEKQLPQLINPDELVLSDTKAKIIIDYPVRTPVVFDINSDQGFTRRALALKISEIYHKIYTEEESSAQTKTTPVKDRKKLLNRNETDGKYGIWGHDLSDLALSNIEVHKNKQGDIVLVLSIES